MKIVFLDAHTINPGDLSWEALQSLGELHVFDRTPESEIVARARGADVLLTMRTPVSAETIKQAWQMGVTVKMVTGDHERAARKVADATGMVEAARVAAQLAAARRVSRATP
jgi:3-deoxy-D-manno-octulosonic-acid transferase